MFASSMSGVGGIWYRLGSRCLHATSSPLNYYKTLGVGHNATAKEIKAAYFGLAKKCHPDVSSDTASKERFQEISKAYQVLSDDLLRREYDEELLTDEEFTFKSDIFREETPEGVFRGAFNISFDELFSKRFGYSAEQENQQEYRIGISLAEAVQGSDKYIEINTYIRCTECQGQGTQYGAEKSRYQCPRCYGGGEVPVGEQLLDWMGQYKSKIEEWTTCGDCLGRGYIITAHCDKCNGIGRQDYLQWHHITIPPGVKHGQVLSCPGVEGETLLITVYILKIPGALFEYCEEGVQADITVNYSTLVQGGQVRVPTLTGAMDALFVPPGTVPSTLLQHPTLTQPLHFYNVQLFLPDADKITTQLHDSYGKCLKLEKDVLLASTELDYNYCETIHLNTACKWQLFRNDLFNLTFRPLVNSAILFRPILVRAIQRLPLVGKYFQMLDEDKYSTSYNPPDRGNYRRL